MKFAFIFLALLSVDLSAQDISGPQLLEKSIAYHDPDGSWKDLKIAVYYDEYRADNTIRKTVVRFDNLHDRFKMERANDKLVITRGTVGDSCYVLVNGSAEIDAELEETYNLSCERSFMYRNYYLYMQGLPMKLNDPGTIVHEQVTQEQFMGMNYYKLKVTYEENVGSDVWYFYINPDNYAVEAYQFYHDEAQGDGEYITLEGEITVAGMKWPQTRKWYTNKEDKYLGKDVIVETKR